jgi:hypothetical protein
MSKTFDNIAEAASTNYLFLKAQMTLSLAQELPTPPPLYVLSFPSELLCATLRLVKRLAPEDSNLSKWAAMPSCFERWADYLQKQKHEPTRTDPRITLQRGASNRSHSKNMTQGDTIKTRAKAITKYVLDHQSDVAQEERWRTSMQRKMDQNHQSFRELVVKANKESQKNQDQMKANQKQYLANQKQFLANQVQMKVNQEKMKANQEQMEANQKQNLANQEEMKENQNKIEQDLKELHAELCRISGL